MEESDANNEEASEASEAEDLPLSDAEDTQSKDQDILLRIDYNGRILTKEDKCENAGDDCDMQFAEKNVLLGRRDSESGLHTSTEDLNVSEDEEKSSGVSTFLSVNLDGIASSSTKNDTGSLSTLNYSHTVFKDEYSANSEYISDEEISGDMKENCIRKNKHKTLPPGLTVAGFPSALKTASSVILPTLQKALNTKHVFSNSLLLDEDIHNIPDDQESPPMTCLEFLKSELSDDNNTDAEDISVGSITDVGISEREINLSSVNAVPSGDKDVHLGGSRRSSAAGFYTEDEIFSMENFPNYCQKRVKKRNFRIVHKNEVSDGDSGTDEEIL